MDKEDKKKKGFLSAVWSIATSTPAKIFYGFVAAAIVGPLLFDMGTWWGVFHNVENIRAMAFRDVMSPFTGWIPYHMGLTEPGGFFYDTMTAFLGEELQILEGKAEASKVASNTYDQMANTATDSVTQVPDVPSRPDEWQDFDSLGDLAPAV